jgi:NitT/TauT family transport system permease protein
MRAGGWRPWRSARVLRWALVAAVFVVLQLLTAAGSIAPVVLPRPTQIVSALVDLVPTARFGQDLARTGLTVAIAFAIGLVGGVVLGALSWRLRLLGDVLEPYLVTLYAMPTLVFYPILVALMGVGMGPIVVIASVMVLIPIALNTMIALRAVNPALEKMGRSVNCTRSQLYRKVLIPAATPLAVPGIKLGFIYAVIGTVAMEFILADRGLGFRIGFDYRQFDIEEMWGLILAVALLSVLVTSALGWIERRIRRDML